MLYWKHHYYTNIEVKQHWVTVWELQVLLTKQMPGTVERAKQMGSKLFQVVKAQGKFELFSGQLAGDCCNGEQQEQQQPR